MNISSQQKKILEFLREETFTNAAVIQTLLQQSSIQAAHQILKRMTRERLVSAAIFSMPSNKSLKIYGITECGHDYAWQPEEHKTNNTVFNHNKFSTFMLQHELDMQMIHINAERNGWTQWRNTRHVGKRTKNTKYPDALAESPGGECFCFEIEREIKNSSTMRTVLASHLAMRKRGHWQKIVYLCPTTDMAQRLKRKVENLSYLRWEGRQIPITPAHIKPFIFSDYDFFKHNSNEDFSR
jgi:hypothetical protein